MASLKILEFISIFGRLVRADLIKCWKIFHSEVDTGLLDGFTVAVDRRSCDHSFKIVVQRCVLEMRRRCFHVRVIQWRNSSSENTVCPLHCLPLRESWIGNWENTML